MHSRVLFIVNRSAGSGGHDDLQREIQFACARAGLLPDVEFTRAAGHATELARQAVAAGYPRVAAVGGDGTVNEIAASLVGTDTTLAIVPTGSGNGLARHLNLPLTPTRALTLFQTGRTLRMDALRINDRYSFNVSGTGFDGLVAERFGQGSARGLRNYVKVILAEFPRFAEFSITVASDERIWQEQAFIVAMANSSQFGNNAVVAPRASVCDGKVDICLIRKPGWLQLPAFLMSMFTRQVDQSKFVKTLQTDHCRLSMTTSQACHLDGEPGPRWQEIQVRVMPACLDVLVPGVGGRV